MDDREFPPMKINVKQADIERGNYQSWGCPVALAIQRTTRRKVCAGMAWITFANGETYRTPEQVKEFIERYDKDRPVKPFTFDLTKGGY